MVNLILNVRVAELGLTLGAGITPPPGTYMPPTAFLISRAHGGNIDIGGVVFNGGAKAEIFSEGVSILTVPETKVLDGYLGLLVSVPVSHINLEARDRSLGATRSVTVPKGGVLAIQHFRCNSAGIGRFLHTFHVLGVIPTGRYQPGFYPLTGFNRPHSNIGWAFTWFEKNTKLQFNGAVGFMTSLENEATQYQTGDEFHAEWAVGYKFDNGLVLGVAGYDYRQIRGDSGQVPIWAHSLDRKMRSGLLFPIQQYLARCRSRSAFGIMSSTTGRTSSTGMCQLPRLPRPSRPVSHWSCFFK